jgi:transposase-like protein
MREILVTDPRRVCPACHATNVATVGDFRACPDCGYHYRWRLTRRLAETLDGYAEGKISYPELIKAIHLHRDADLDALLDGPTGPDQT